MKRLFVSFPFRPLSNRLSLSIFSHISPKGAHKPLRGQDERAEDVGCVRGGSEGHFMVCQ